MDGGRRCGRDLRLLLLAVELRLEDVAAVGALLHLAQGAVPHALEGDELREQRVQPELEGRVLDQGALQRPHALGDALALVVRRPTVDPEEVLLVQDVELREGLVHRVELFLQLFLGEGRSARRYSHLRSLPAAWPFDLCRRGHLAPSPEQHEEGDSGGKDTHADELARGEVPPGALCPRTEEIEHPSSLLVAAKRLDQRAERRVEDEIEREQLAVESLPAPPEDESAEDEQLAERLVELCGMDRDGVRRAQADDAICNLTLVGEGFGRKPGCPGQV